VAFVRGVMVNMKNLLLEIDFDMGSSVIDPRLAHGGAGRQLLWPSDL
jgi:hypothetical protein